MNFSVGGSSSTSKVFYSQPSTSHSKVNEISRRGSKPKAPVDTKTFKTFIDGEEKEVILLSSDSEEETDEQEHGTEREISTSATIIPQLKPYTKDTATGPVMNQEILRDGVDLRPPHHNYPPILVDQQKSFLSANPANIILEKLKMDAYEKLEELGLNGLYWPTFFSYKSHSIAKPLNTQTTAKDRTREKNEKSQRVTTEKTNLLDTRIGLNLTEGLNPTLQSSQEKTKTDVSTTSQQSTNRLSPLVINFTSLNEINSYVPAQGRERPPNGLNNQIVDSTSSTRRHTSEVVRDSCLQPTTTSYEINPSPLNNDEGKQYTHIMGHAIQEVAFATLAIKHNPQYRPRELGSVVNKFKSTQAYDDLINTYNYGGMDLVIDRLEQNLSSHLVYQPKENKKKRKRR